MELLDTSIANVALPYIGGGLGRSYDEVTWILTTYLVANAVILPMSAWLSRVFGRKTYYLACVALFTLTSFFCGLAPSLGIMLSSRMLQGIAGGGLAPVAQAILVDTFPAAKRASAFALYTIVIVTAPAIGPVLGGWITDNYNWRWIFLGVRPRSDKEAGCLFCGSYLNVCDTFSSRRVNICLSLSRSSNGSVPSFWPISPNWTTFVADA